MSLSLIDFAIGNRSEHQAGSSDGLRKSDERMQAGVKLGSALRLKTEHYVKSSWPWLIYGTPWKCLLQN